MSLIPSLSFLRKHLLLLACICLSLSATAQDQHITDNEQLLKEYLSQKKFPIDSTAKAVILYEKGISFISGGMLEHKIERVVKIISSDAAADFAAVSIAKGNDASVSRIKGATYNLKNGVIDKQAIDRSDVLKDEVDNSTTVFKFNLPSVKEGSVIHYTFTVTTPSWITVPDWSFQSEYPTLESVYEINVPSYINYTPVERVNVNMPRVDNQKQLASTPDCSFMEVTSNQTNHTFIRRNIPAFKKEPFMSSIDNFVERVKIHIASVKSEYITVPLYTDWQSVSKKWYYLNDKFCGQAFANNHFLKETVEELTKDKKDDLEKAKAIFSFVRNNMRQKESMKGNQASGLIKEVYNKKEGSTDGINLLLTAMLRRAGLNSEPVLLSTRKNERLNSFYPTPENVDYVVSKVMIEKKNYFLDASVKQMPFGLLAPDCYNGYCWVVNEKGSSVTLEPDSIKNKTTVIITLAPAGKDSKGLIMKVDRQFGHIAALEYRKEWQKDTSSARKMVQKDLSQSTYPLTLRGYQIKNLDDPDQPLIVHYEANMDFKDDVETIYLDPCFAKFYHKNPFPDVARKYNVEMDCLDDINYVFRLELPEGYEVDDFPKSTSLQFGENKLLSMKSIYNYDKESKSLTLNSRFTSYTTVFHPDLYEQLRSFYEKMIEEQNKKIVIKKSRI